MAKRLSSIFSLGSNNSDSSSNVSRPRSAFNPGGAADHHLPSPQLTSHKSTPDLRVGASSSQADAEHLQAAMRAPPMDTSRLSPHFSPTMSPPLPGLEEDGPLLSPLPQALRKPIPQQSESPDGSRPQSRIRTPGSRSPSRDGSVPHSQAASPATFRPVTPTGDQSKSSKRKSWLPGSRGKPESQSDEMNGIYGNESWIITPQAQHKLRYDLVPLVNFQKVIVSLPKSMTLY